MREFLFVNPPSSVTNQPYFPTGLAYLNAILRQADVDSALLDLDALMRIQGGYSRQTVECSIRQSPAKVYGVTAMSATWPWAAEVIRTIRWIFPGATIVVGGPLPTLLGQRILELTPEIDYICVGEWEPLIVGFAGRMLAGSPCEDLPNLWYRDAAGNVRSSPRSSLTIDLDSLPLPTVPPEDYAGIEVLNVEVGRGCPFSCIFCSVAAIRGRRPRHKSPERVLNESLYFLDRYGEPGRRIVSLEHDDLLSNKDFLARFGEIKRAGGHGFRYAISTRITHLTEQAIEELKRSGCIHIFIGVESGSKRLQQLYLKRIRRDTAWVAVERLHRARIAVTCNFIVGFPEETAQDVADTLKLMAELAERGAKVSVSYFCPEPGSRAASRCPQSEWIPVTDSPFFLALEKDGLDPKMLDRETHAFLYTVANSEFDVLEKYAEAIALTTELNSKAQGQTNFCARS